MRNFNFSNFTDIRFGTDQIEAHLHDALAKYGKNVLIVYGGGSIKKNGLYERVMQQLADLNVFELGGIEPNPKVASIEAGQKLTQEHDIDVLLAIGGGSVIDATKLIASAKFYDGNPWDLVLDSKKRRQIAQLPVVDILTLAATGSEMNKNSVISNPQTHQKLGTGGPNSPVVSFLDPTLTYSVSKWQTAAGSIDILSHLTEQYFDQATNTDVQDGMMEGLMRAVIEWAPVALAEPTNYDARANLMWASTMALNGLVRTGKESGWTVHGIEHELSAYYDVTHGMGLGVLTPRWMRFALNAETEAKFARYGRNVWDLTGNDQAVAQAAIQATYDWIKALQAPTTLGELGINTTENFAAMAKSAVELKHLDKVAYVPMTIKDVNDLYVASMTTDGFE